MTDPARSQQPLEVPRTSNLPGDPRTRRAAQAATVLEQRLEAPVVLTPEGRITVQAVGGVSPPPTVADVEVGAGTTTADRLDELEAAVEALAASQAELAAWVGALYDSLVRSGMMEGRAGARS